MKKILVVVDMQNDFVDGALGTKEAEAIVDSVADKIKNFDGDIFVTLDTHFEDYMNTNEGNKLPVPHCIRGTEGWRINEKVQRALDEKEYTKVEKVTFGSVGLPQLIIDTYNVAEIEIELVGLCTDICVVSNALLLKAHFPEMKISVDSACCAGVTPQKHNAALETMESCQIDIL